MPFILLPRRNPHYSKSLHNFLRGLDIWYWNMAEADSGWPQHPFFRFYLVSETQVCSGEVVQPDENYIYNDKCDKLLTNERQAETLFYRPPRKYPKKWDPALLSSHLPICWLPCYDDSRSLLELWL